MANANFRVEERAIAKQRDVSALDVVDWKRQEAFGQDMREGFTKLREAPVAWKTCQGDVALWDSFAGETLANEPPYDTRRRK